MMPSWIRPIAGVAALLAVLAGCGSDEDARGGRSDGETAEANQPKAAATPCPGIEGIERGQEQMTLVPTRVRPGQAFRAIYPVSRVRGQILYVSATRDECTVYVVTQGDGGGSQWHELQEGEAAFTSMADSTSEIATVVPDFIRAGVYRVCDAGGNCAGLDVIN